MAYQTKLLKFETVSAVYGHSDMYQELFDEAECDVMEQARAYLSGKREGLSLPAEFPKRINDWCGSEEQDRILAHVVLGNWIEAEAEMRKALIHPYVQKQLEV